MDPRDLPDDWQVWLADNLLRGVPDVDVRASLVERGLSLDRARALVDAARAHPFMRAARPHVEALLRRDSLLGVQGSLAALAPSGPVARRRFPGVDAFLREHYAAQRPVILVDALADLPALARWTFDHLAGTHGHLDIEVQDGREAAPDYQRVFERTCRRTTLGALIERIAGGNPSNDVYLTARNRLLAQPGAQVLLEELHPLPAILVTPPRADDAAVWIGPAGTVTPLHHDWVNAAFAQLQGRKRFLLAAPWEAPRVANRESRFADVDLERDPPAGLVAFEVVLEPGELLFVPVGWWHQVRALEPSISVSFTGFVYPNRYAWDADTRR
jgi:hypothetical protein